MGKDLSAPASSVSRSTPLSSASHRTSRHGGQHRPDVDDGCVGSSGEGGNCADDFGAQSEHRLPVRRLSVGEELAVEERQTRAASAIDFTADPAKVAAGY